MNTEKFINYLNNQKFNNQQIELLSQLNEKGYELVNYYNKESGVKINLIKEKYIKSEDSIEDLKRLSDILTTNNFNNEQAIEIVKGYSLNIGYEIYSNVDFSSEQMYEIRKGLENGIDVTKYNDIKYNCDQMEEVRLGLEKGIDMTPYCDETFNKKQMQEIRDGLEYKIDVTKYNDKKYDSNQMRVLKDILKYNKNVPDKAIDISLFQNEKIEYWKMISFVRMLVSKDEFLIKGAYEKLSKYDKKEIDNINNDER
jgi:hypothetical protein